MKTKLPITKHFQVGLQRIGRWPEFEPHCVIIKTHVDKEANKNKEDKARETRR